MKNRYCAFILSVTCLTAQNYSVEGFPGTNMGMASSDDGQYVMIAVSGSIVGSDGTDSASVMVPGSLVQAAVSNDLLAVDEELAIIPDRFELNAPYPNPFNAQTNLTFDIDVESFVTLQIFDLRGRLVTTLVNESMKPGVYRIPWNARNSRYEKISSGIYLIRLSNENSVQTGKLVLLQ